MLKCLASFSSLFWPSGPQTLLSSILFASSSFQLKSSDRSTEPLKRKQFSQEQVKTKLELKGEDSGLESSGGHSANVDLCLRDVERGNCLLTTQRVSVMLAAYSAEKINYVALRNFSIEPVAM